MTFIRVRENRWTEFKFVYDDGREESRAVLVQAVLWPRFRGPFVPTDWKVREWPQAEPAMSLGYGVERVFKRVEFAKFGSRNWYEFHEVK